ncbi:MAG: ComF family protein [Actinomycetota bacterium]
MLLDDVVALFAPLRCLSCGGRGSMLCPSCSSTVPRPPDDLKLPGVTRCGAPWRYQGRARDLVLALKLRGRRPAAEPLAAAIVGWLAVPPVVVTWVPGRRSDIRRRGFDHAEAIARAVAKSLRVEARPLLHRIGSAPDQTTLSRAERLRNLGHVFSATHSPSEVLLVDDLITTGATVSACATALRRAGARRVVAVAACRA